MSSEFKKNSANQQNDKPCPAFLNPKYPYKAIGEAITDAELIEPKLIYEIKCNQCEMSIRSQGQNIRSAYEKMKSDGCIGCGNRELVIKRVDIPTKL